MRTTWTHTLSAHDDMIDLIISRRFFATRMTRASQVSILFADLRATRAWFAQRESGWTPAMRVRRAAINAREIWAE